MSGDRKTMDHLWSIGWLARRRRRRGQNALARMLEFQRAKARRFLSESYDPREGMMRHSLRVRGMLEEISEVGPEVKVLEVGSGAHGLIFFFGAARGIGLDPLAHHYVRLFPAWQRRVPTLSACGERLPFRDKSFGIVLSDDVVDYAEDPELILSEMARVLRPSGMLYLSVNISHPVWRAVAVLYDPADFHTTLISLSRARALFKRLPMRLVREKHNIAETRVAVRNRREHRLRAWLKSIFYYKARYEAVAVSKE